MTQRPLILPLTMSSKISLTSSSFRSSTVQATLPSPAIARHSFRSARVPTMEPRIVFRCRMSVKMSTGKSAGGRATPTAKPMGRSMSTPWRKAAGAGARIRLPWGPWPSHAFFTSATTSSPDLPSTSTYASALSSPVAYSPFAAPLSIAQTLRPMAFAYCTPTWPRPPQAPMIATHCPGLASVSLSALYVVTPAQRIGEAWAKLSPSGILPT
mmetsp:Transcript_16048/g.48216  ORF Transcript_16048/g.48216 Transcript_16048/m.48216 type:complete len:212 (-) Transcript_16048:625-1260(-)